MKKVIGLSTLLIITGLLCASNMDAANQPAEPSVLQQAMALYNQYQQSQASTPSSSQEQPGLLQRALEYYNSQGSTPAASQKAEPSFLEKLLGAATANQEATPAPSASTSSEPSFLEKLLGAATANQEATPATGSNKTAATTAGANADIAEIRSAIADLDAKDKAGQLGFLEKIKLKALQWQLQALEQAK